MKKHIRSRSEDEPYITKCVFEIVKAKGEWVTVDDISKRTGITRLAVTLAMKNVRELMEYYDMFGFITFHRLKGYSYSEGSMYTGAPKNMVLKYLKNQDDWVSSVIIAEYFDISKGTAQKYMREYIKNGLVTSMPGCKGGYKYIGG